MSQSLALENLPESVAFALENTCERPLRIALFHTTLPAPGRKLGGVEVAVHRLANALTDLGRDEVTVLSLTPAPPDARYRHRQLFAKYPWLWQKRFVRLFFMSALLNFVKMDEYDLLHTHGDDWFFINRRIPTVRTMHGSSLMEGRTATSLKRRLVQYAFYPLERFSTRLCTLPAAIGQEAAGVYGIDRVVDNGVDMTLFYPGEKLPKPRLLFVGTWEGRKRGKFLFDLFTQQVLPRCPEAELCMVSDQCAEHPSVIHEVYPSDTTLAQRYRESWVFAYPSIYEGFGIAYIEALASETPVVCSPNAGAEYVLGNGKYGDIVSDEQFADRLVELLQSETKRRQMAEAGRARAAEFSWDLVAKRHRALYCEALAR